VLRYGILKKDGKKKSIVNIIKKINKKKIGKDIHGCGQPSTQTGIKKTQ
jgi:hypothetical protein